MTDLLTRLRQLARAEHDDLDVVDEAVEEIINLRTDVHVLQEMMERYKHDSALQSQKPEPNDLMLSGVLRMPFDMAMATELSRVQFYQRAQQALNELEVLQLQDREDALRYRYLVIKLQQAYDGEYFETDLMSIYCHMPSQYKGERVVRAEITWRDKADEPIGLSEAIDHARRIEGEGMSVPTMQAWEVWQARANIDSLRFRDEPVRCAVCGTHEVSAAVTCQNSSCPVYVNALRAHEERK